MADLTVPGVPQAVTREAYLALIRALGFPDTDHLRLLEFRPDGIYAEVFPAGKNGKPFVTGTGPSRTAECEVVVHRVWIPVVGDKPKPVPDEDVHA